MRRFNISVNGQSYDVVVDEVDGKNAPAPVAVSTPAPAVAATPAAVATPAPAAAPTPAAASTPVAVPANAEKILTPMPGTIMDVKVAVGDNVEKNQVLVILEAMKMENEIVSTCDGKVIAISVRKGDSVNTSDVLVSIG